ncbi:MAG: NADH-dependent [FeFe] hydrogenase, group A6 [Candidatus Omnitrophica bacterium]|jgi:NADH-quinone oxidoreductase subunit G|nr:NADH-dependent [FeFe] hydrogenase, group A6 [Candidatus Omnitrophota bacterium]
MTKKTVQAKINGILLRVEEGTTILDAAKKVQIKIPTLCKHPDLPSSAACGICIVKIKGASKMARACCTPVEEGMEIITHDPEIVEIRRTVIELILSNHPNDCLKCARNNDCELQRLTADFGIKEESFSQFLRELPIDQSTKAVDLDPKKCILCGRCVHVCQENQDVWALSFLERGIKTRISPAGDIQLADSPCVKCGQCAAHCPTGAFVEQDSTLPVWKALQDPSKYCVVQIAPAVRVSIGEAFGYTGKNFTKKLYALLRRLGFQAVFDTSFAADVTIMEEASEFEQRLLKGNRPLPLITSCCPSWVDFMEKFYTDMIDHFSSCKSPHEILGVLSKTYYAQKNKIDPANIFMTSIMPCTSKKYEITRNEEMFASGHQDIDAVLCTRELSRMIKQAGIDFESLPEEESDSILGEYAGAGVIFGATGGVMEAAIRTAHYLVTGKELKNVEFESVRGIKGIKETEIDISGKKIKIAVAHGLGNVEYILNKVRQAKDNNEEIPYHFIEVMACPGGCIGGGGQPYMVTDELRLKRAKAIYQDDSDKKIRCSHQNPYVKRLYKEFLGKPLGEVSEKFLHTHYKPRPLYKK